MGLFEVSVALIASVVLVIALMAVLPMWTAINTEMSPAINAIDGGAGSAILNMWPIIAILLVIAIPIGAIVSSMRQSQPQQPGGLF